MSDAISKNMVLRKLMDIKMEAAICVDSMKISKETENKVVQITDAFAELIQALPTIDAAPVVHARWRYKVAYVSHAHVTNIIWCTACNYGFHRIEGENFNFCPNCGARMDGEEK